MAETRRSIINKNTTQQQQQQQQQQRQQQQQQPSRLQKRRPASLQITPASSSTWNAAIPLLSPLCASPTAIDQMADVRSTTRVVDPTSVETQQPVVYKKWQHPAAPFCNEPAGSLANSFFVPV